MFIGHLPAGYLASTWLAARLARQPARRRRLLSWGLVCSLLPDLDLIYFYTLDQRQHAHHGYWSHIPACWIACFALLLVLSLTTCRRALPYVITAALAVLLHLALDTVAGGIRWGYPLSAAPIALVEVPARHAWWVANFALHWTAGLEVGLWVAALTLAARSRRQPGPALVADNAARGGPLSLGPADAKIERRGDPRPGDLDEHRQG